MDLKSAATLLAVILLTFGLTRWLFPKETVRTIQLPGSTDTVEVTSEQLDTIWRERVRWRDRVTTDTIVVADSVRITDTVHVEALRARWYLDSASVAQSEGDTSFYALTWLRADSSGIIRRDAIESHITLGPVRQIALDSAGLSVDYGAFPEAGCDLGCRLGWAGGGALAGLLIIALSP